MVVLTFEGPDNLGKSTIINKIVSNFKDTKDICMIHSTGPHTADGEDPFVYQTNIFRERVLKLLVINSSESQCRRSPKNIVIMDRSWYGEYVYGQIYRNGDKKKIIEMINSYDKSLAPIKHKCVINLTASPEFIVSHDDGLSFTSNFEYNKKVESVKKELALFNECFKKIKTKNVITINVEGIDNEYRDINDIYNEIINKLNELKIDLND